MKTAGSRVHVVLVPGFAGFDALGQLEYYAGVTPFARAWREGRAGPPVVLHYFDNLPTASVATRAGRLRQYLAKRWARGELQPGDAVALVGHSTGGLDIRRLLVDLDADARQDRVAVAVDGNRHDAYRVPPGQLLELVKRVVFLSVPQRGTNIADFVRRIPRGTLLSGLRLLVSAARGSIANDVEEAGARLMSGALHSDLLLAVGDAVAEMDVRAVRNDAPRTADAHEAASELELFLTHVASDFSAIDDLAAEPDPLRRSPAHFDEAQRDAERSVWDAWDVETRSFATVGRPPYAFDPGEVVAAWDVLHPLAPWSRLLEGAKEWADAPYLCGYRACAGGPFGAASPAGERAATLLDGSGRRTLERWDNDGIVNTASMLWPDGEATRLVDGDHGDVIGHYRLVEALDGPPLRRYHTYDLLRSGSGFDDARFREVWTQVLDFCAGAGGAAGEGEAAA